MSAKRRRIPRRRLHWLRIDIVLVALSFAVSPLLLAPALPRLRAVAPKGPTPSFSIAILPPGSVPAIPPEPFAPSLAGLPGPESAEAAARDGLPTPTDVPPPSASTPPSYPVTRTPVPAEPNSPRDALSTMIPPGGIPPPSAGAFATIEPLPTIPQTGAANGSGEVFLFRSAGQTIPTVVVDSPDLPPSAVSAIERALLSTRREPVATDSVERISLPLPRPAANP